MKSLKVILLLLLVAFCTEQAAAQIIKDPTTWTYTAKRKFGNHFELFFKVKLASGWHIYSLTPGGDEGLIPPSFTVGPANGLKLVGKVKELGKPVTEKMDGIEGTVSYFNGEATFVQEVEVPWGKVVKVTGKHEYQVCNDRTCLPPKKKSFSFTVKP